MKLGLYAVCFVVGMLALYWWSELPGQCWFYGGGAIALGALSISTVRPWAVMLAGFCWAGLDATDYQQAKLPALQHGVDVIVTGHIASFPKGDRQRITFIVNSNSPVSEEWSGGRLRLSWREPDEIPLPGQEWRFSVRLFAPSGMLNQGGFDYEKWLFTDDIVATGYVRGDFQQLDSSSFSAATIRRSLRQRIDAVATQHQLHAAGLIKALLIGDRSGIDQQHNQAFRATGTSHLIAISGLHIGLIATICWFLANYLWSRSVNLMRWRPAPMAGAVAAICGALLYAALAGFSLPTQRAVIMTTVFAASTCLKMNYPPWHRLVIALILVVIHDPRSIWQSALWFSFGAVFLLLSLYHSYPKLSGWQLLIIAQLLLTALMLPIQAFFEMPLSLVSPLVNWFAVPWFSVVLVPVSLIAALVSLLGLDWFFVVALQLSEWTLELIHLIANNSLSLRSGNHHLFASLLAVAAVLLGLRVSSWRRLLVPVMLYSISWIKLPSPQAQLKVVVFDVGQGQSLLIETPNHRLLYDLGPAFRSGFSTAEAVIIPYLQSRRIDAIDILILSHDDNDHTGAADAFMNQIKTHQLFEGQAVTETAHHQPRACRAGQQWQWDGVDFEILHPRHRDAAISDNDMSCVLLVKYRETSLLISGDITKKSENELLTSTDLSDVSFVTLPHHGSNTSSSGHFVSSLQADYGVISSGWRNRYGHPREAVTSRWLASGTALFDTADSGMLVFSWQSGAAPPMIEEWRRHHRSFWNRSARKR